jgi:hypothetical protein
MWYTVSEKNGSNTFKIQLFNVKNYDDSEYILHVPSGNYTAEQMQCAINNLLLNNGIIYLYFDISQTTGCSSFRLRVQDDHQSCGQGGETTTTIPDISNPASDDYSPNFYYKIKFNEPIIVDCAYSAKSTFGKFLGFQYPEYTVSITDIVKDDMTLPYPQVFHAMVSGELTYGNGRTNYIFVSVNDFIKNYITTSVIAANHGLYLGDDILGRVAITENANTIMINTARS